MARNIEYRIADGHEILLRHPSCDLTFEEVKELMGEPSMIYDKEQVFIAISRAFELGISIGSRLAE